MIIDLLDENLHAEADIAEAIEALEPPPISLSSAAYAVYWLVALAPFWRSCLYTFSEILYQELTQMPAAKQRYAERLFSVAISIREAHPEITALSMKRNSLVLLTSLHSDSRKRCSTRSGCRPYQSGALPDARQKDPGASSSNWEGMAHPDHVPRSVPVDLR